jgi:hypothetical protein
MRPCFYCLLVSFVWWAHPLVATGEAPVIEKLGTLECDLVEASPIVYRGRLYRFEYVRPNYKYNTTGNSYFRFVDLDSKEASAPFGRGFHLGSAYVEDNTVYAYGVSTWGASQIVVFKSNDWSNGPRRRRSRLLAGGSTTTTFAQPGTVT